MRALVVAVAVGALVVSPVAPGSARTALCAGAQLRGTFAYVPGSGAAGHVSYALDVRNASQGACIVAAIPQLRLLDVRGRGLPTRIVPARSDLAVGRFVLRPGRRARATARFSPDVPGPGEPTSGPCERTATTLRVTPGGGGAMLVPVRPKTAVCEHGRMVFSGLRAR